MIEYKLQLKKKVLKFIQKRTPKDKANIDSKLKLLKQNPYPNTLLDIKNFQTLHFID